MSKEAHHQGKSKIWTLVAQRPRYLKVPYLTASALELAPKRLARRSKVLAAAYVELINKALERK